MGGKGRRVKQEYVKEQLSRMRHLTINQDYSRNSDHCDNNSSGMRMMVITLKNAIQKISKVIKY